MISNSDLGYILGQHGGFEKHCLYEDAVRSALMMRLPGVIAPGRATDALVELIDIGPPLLDLCGVEIPPDVQGRSLAPLLRAATDRHRDHVVAAYADNAEAMVRTARWKLVYCAGNRVRRVGYALDHDPPGRSVQLYALEADPGETCNVSGNPEHAAVIADLIARPAEHVRRTERDPSRVPGTRDVHALMEWALPPTELAP